MTEINLPEQIIICGTTFTVNKTESYGADFSCRDKVINVGCSYIDKGDIVENLIHEISEIIHITLGIRFDSTGNDNYFFHFDHSQFQSHNEILVNTLFHNKIINHSF